MRARTFFSPYFILLFTLLVLALLEWMNIASPRQSNPQQDQSRQAPSALKVIHADGAVWVNGAPDTTATRQWQILPREFLLAGQTYLPRTVYPLRTLLLRSG